MNVNQRHILLALLIAVAASTAWAKSPITCPDGYYSAAEGKNQKALLQALYGIIGSHTTIGYDGLWNAYADTDTDDDGYYIDMYSTYDKFTYSNKCGNYSDIGDCVNREHSFPKGWWGGNKAAQYSDIFHLYPTDGYVNNQRGSYPFGECANGTRLSNGSYVAKGRLGPSTFSGYSGTVFEPDDEYKGDFARTYFYMATAYNNVIANWTSGNGSAMMAGNNYPCFNTWAINLLLKWHRQDPVSEKEIKRNNYAHAWQGNRNPYIDHPELAEYIWGNKTSETWSESGSSTTTATLTQPVDGTTIDMGTTRTNAALTYSLNIAGTGLTSPLTVALSDNDNFMVSSSSITAAAANAGTTLTVTFLTDEAMSASTTLTLSSSQVSATVTFTAQAIEGIPALPATNVTSTSFNANWTNVDKAGTTYYLWVGDLQENAYDDEYPVAVTASSQTYKVTGLSPLTTYTYWLTADEAGTLNHSNVITVKTTDVTRTITIETGSGLQVSAEPGGVSEIAQAAIITENVTENITVALDAGDNFELSLDKSTWAQSITVDPSGETFYVRLKSTTTAGTYEGTITATTPSGLSAEATVTGTIAEQQSFIEDWEKATAGGYYNETIQGSACKWIMVNTGIFGQTNDKYHDTQGARMGKDSNSSITMAEDKTGGAGTVTYYAATYGSDADATIVLSYSTDGGSTWTEVQTITTTSTMQQYSCNISATGNVRLKFQQTAGSRVNIDDIAITDYSTASTLLGDVNLDGRVDAADIACVVNIITGKDAAGTYGTRDDVNGDGSVNSGDIAALVQIITSGSADAPVNTLHGERWDAAAGHGYVSIHATSATPIEIYNLDAELVATRVVVGTERISLPAGTYVVVTDETSTRVIVK